MKSKKKIMILGASILQVPAIIKAKEMGYTVVAVDMNKDAIGFKDADIKVVESTIDIPKVVKAAKELEVDGVMTLASDMPMRTVAAVAKELNIVGIDMETAIKATNKYEMRKALKLNNVPIPKYYKVSNENEFIDILDNFSGEFILKPADNSGSRGIYKLNAKDSLDNKIKAYNYCHNFSRNGDVVVEEFMVGKEISVETLSINGECHVIQITDKLTTGAPYFVEMGHTQPTQHSQETIEKIKEVAKAAVKAIGIKNGPSHTEIMVTKEGPKIVELGARLGGDCITTHLVPLSTGVNMVENCIKIALGEEIDIKPKFKKASAIRYLECNDGVIESINGIDEAKKVENIKQISIVHDKGSKVSGIRSSADRIGFVIAQANSVEDAVKACEKAKEKIIINMVE